MYKAQLTHWHREGLPKAVAVKTLKGAVTIYKRASLHMHPNNPHFLAGLSTMSTPVIVFASE